MNPETKLYSVNEYLDICMKWQNVPDKYKNVLFSQLQGSPLYLKVLGKIANWDFKSPETLSILSENNGIGKTHIAWTLVKKYLSEKLKSEPESISDPGQRSKYSSFFFKEYQILNMIKNSYDGDGPNEKQMKEYFINKPLLVIDDLFRTKTTDWTINIMFEIIDCRGDWLRPTIITSNYNLKDIQGMSSALASRIANEYLFEFSGEMTDWRNK